MLCVLLELFAKEVSRVNIWVGWARSEENRDGLTHLLLGAWLGKLYLILGIGGLRGGG